MIMQGCLGRTKQKQPCFYLKQLKIMSLSLESQDLLEMGKYMVSAMRKPLNIS